MSQLSRPYQIALVAVLVLGLAYFLVLRPSSKSDSSADGSLPGEIASTASATSAAPNAPGAAGLGRAIAKAKGAVAQSNAAPVNGLSDAAAASTATSTAAPTTTSAQPARIAKPSAAAAASDGDTAATKLLSAARAGKVVAVLFYNPEARDDRATRRSLLAVRRRGGRLVVRAVPISSLARYTPIVRGVDIEQSPTILVFGKTMTASKLTGYQDSLTIDQLVGDVGGTSFVDPALTAYAAKVGNICRVLKDDVSTEDETTDDRLQIGRLLDSDLAAAQRQIGDLKTPARYRSFGTRFRQYLVFLKGPARTLTGKLNTGADPLAASTAFFTSITPRAKAITQEAKAAHVDCSG